MRAVLILILLTSPAWADEADKTPMPDKYSEALKVLALKEAYHLNGDSMVRWGCIDMSGPEPAVCPMPGPPPLADAPPEKKGKK